jgi:hypothetical protein
MLLLVLLHQNCKNKFIFSTAEKMLLFVKMKRPGISPACKVLYNVISVADPDPDLDDGTGSGSESTKIDKFLTFCAGKFQEYIKTCVLTFFKNV